MSVSKTNPVIRISPNPPVFDLPVLVALEEGLFAKAGLDVRLVADYRDNDFGDRDVLKRQKEALFECGSADAFNVCEWGASTASSAAPAAAGSRRCGPRSRRRRS